MVAVARQISVPGFALEFAREQFYEGNIERGRRYFAITSKLSPQMASDVYRALWIAKGSPQGNPRYGEDCFHGRQELSANGRELWAVIQQYWDSLSDARAQQRGDPDPQMVFRCPISYEIMRNPVMDRCGHSFEAENIRLWIENHHSCPESRLQLEVNELTPNLALRTAIATYTDPSRGQLQLGETIGETLIRERNRNRELIETHHVALNYLKWGVRELIDEYLNLQDQSHQIQQTVTQRDGTINGLHAQNDRLTDDTSRLQESERNLQDANQRQDRTIQELNARIQEKDATIQNQARTIQDRNGTIQDQATTISDLDSRLKAAMNKLKNIQNIGCGDALLIAATSLFGGREAVIRKITNRPI
jgi:uncharacterized coiled-coil protein SlyX